MFDRFEIASKMIVSKIGRDMILGQTGRNMSGLTMIVDKIGLRTISRIRRNTILWRILQQLQDLRER
jgi:hypothetical protein